MPSLAHLSDLHATPVRIRGPAEILNKRLLGWLSWLVRRHREHRASVLEALLTDLARVAPDHVAVTGDLTNLGLPEELRAAATWLGRLGGPDRVSIVPGNHDAYVKSPDCGVWEPWSPYLSPLPAPPGGTPLRGPVEFPVVRRFGELALVAVSSARPTLPFLATGRVGSAQRERLAKRLAELGGGGMCRVVLIHHPPLAAGLSRRRQLDDAAALREVLGQAGAELVLHGHAHRSGFREVPGPNGAIPVVGVPSASALGRRGDHRRARYHVIRLERASGPRPFRLSCEIRELRPDGSGFRRREMIPEL